MNSGIEPVKWKIDCVYRQKQRFYNQLPVRLFYLGLQPAYIGST
jgi:hypothetical protein